MYEVDINNFLALNPGIRKETHMESAKSIYPWFKDLWKLVKDFDYKLIGKPYGCTPMLEAMGITNYDRPGIEHDFIDCIDYADYTLGNALGIGIGMKLAKPEAKIFVLISDAQLYMGNVLESLILFKEFDFKDFLICIDYNNKGSKELNSFEFNNLNLFKVKECKLDLEPNDINNKIIVFKHSNHKIFKYILN